MRIDRTHRPWVLATLVIFVIALATYIAYVRTSPTGPRGGSSLGLVYGIAGYALMLYAGFLGRRKKIPTWRIGRAQTWMRGHLWLGLLSFPLILFHAGFAWRGPLTFLLMILFFIVIASGIFGAVLQHYLPSLMRQQVPMETIYEEIPHVRDQLRAEAQQLVTSICGPVEASVDRGAPAGTATGTVVVPLVELQEDDKLRFHEIYLRTMRPFLENPDREDLELSSPKRAAQIFESLRRTLPAPLHPAITDLENIFEEERQLNRQTRLYRLLHTWLIVHVPISIALIVLAAVHAIVALRY